MEKLRRMLTINYAKEPNYKYPIYMHHPHDSMHGSPESTLFLSKTISNHP
jgi:hypothetical protein